MGQRPDDTTSTVVIPITSAADFGQAQAQLLALAGEAEHAHITLAAGVYAQSLSLGMGSCPSTSPWRAPMACGSTAHR